MRMGRGFQWGIFLVGLALSILLTIVFWPFFVGLFLFLPFLWPLGFGRRRGPRRACPRCGWGPRAADDVYCPRDGQKLEEST